MSKSNDTKYKNDFQKEKYDRIIVTVNKGEKDAIEEYRKSKGYKSLNNYITDLIRTDMKNGKNITVGDVVQQGNNNSISIG